MAGSSNIISFKKPSPFPFIVHNHFFFSVEAVEIKSAELKPEVKALSYAE
jgi:hypothetical protein